jgi:rare lipoprotein A
MNKTINLGLIALISLFAISACTTSRYQHSQDFLPNPILDPSTLKDATVKAEPLSSMGNPKKYTVLGKEYEVMTQGAGFKQEGFASWYGMKFHGHATSNGEIYDVYQMTAAHKTLPLPSYVRVTRTDTQESVIVRVNDRGPFHEGRIIDLSYAAAVKLGINKAGTAAVSIEVISAPNKGPEKWLQVSALSNEQSAKALQKKLQAMQQWPVVIASNEKRSLHKIRIGPIPAGQATEKVIVILQQNQLPDPLVLAVHQL